MLTTVTTLALAATLLPPVQDDGHTNNHAQAQQESSTNALMESELGFSIYSPKSESAKTLLRYAQELTDVKVRYYYEDKFLGRIEIGTRDRFIPMGDVIGVQDFKEGRESALRTLEDLDRRLGDLSKAPSQARQDDAIRVRTMRMRALDLNTAAELAVGFSGLLRVTQLNETGTLVLQGPADAVDRAEALLMEVDQPLPQITIRCALIQAVDGEVSDTAGLLAKDDEVARALGRLLPGKRFRKAGELLLRGSGGGNAQLEVTSSMPGFGVDNAATPARVTWRAVVRGLDPQTKTLTLDQCSMQLQIPTFQTVSNGTTVQSQFNGYQSEGLQADLALRADETTVVGSLGGNPVYVSLTFSIED